MADNEQKAMQLMAEAEKKLTGNKGFFGSLFGCVMKISLFFFVPVCLPYYPFSVLKEKSIIYQICKEKHFHFSTC